MKHREWWMVVILIIACLSLSACANNSEGESAEEAPPVVLEPIEGTDFNRVTLTERAAQRLGIETVTVGEEMVSRERTLTGKVEALQDATGNPGVVRVRVPMSLADIAKVAQGQPARVLSLDDDDDDDQDDRWETAAEAMEVDDLDDANDVEEDEDSALYYQLDAPNQNLQAGQNVRVKLSLQSSGSPQLVIPYSAVLYDLNGETWVYTSPEPLVFIRQPITVDYVDGDRAVLLDGPPVGTAIVTVGAPELFGADTGVGK